MKHFELGLPVRRVSISLLAAAVVLVAASSTSADYQLVWSTIDAGGGTSSDARFTVIGTIGQPDVAYSYGGDYEVLGGFWPGAPLCFVEFEDFARFAQYWLYFGSGIPADLYEDNIVDYNDLSVFVDEWLYYCPYNWPLK